MASTWTAAWVKPSSVWYILCVTKVYRVDTVASIKTPPVLSFWIVCVCFLGINPSLWDKADVAHWLHWAQREYSLRRPEKGRFEMNGRALCLLTKEDFRRRCPSSGKWVCMQEDSMRSSFASVFSCAWPVFYRWCSVWDSTVCKTAKAEWPPEYVSLLANWEHWEPSQLPDTPSECQRVPASHRQWQPRSVM